ncbi:MAG: dihydroneopterin aldolase, partial [Chitinophagaceae bacterium]|nr:dihydroneopterin aldolase [Chitinophagaceae bacterium]
MITIHLHQLTFHSFHGIYEEEKLLGNDYEINADIEFHEEHDEITSMRETINYVNLYNIIEQQMNISTPLLETVVMNIGKTIKEKHDTIRSVKIQLTKMHPPIPGIQGEVGVSWCK